CLRLQSRKRQMRFPSLSRLTRCFRPPAGITYPGQVRLLFVGSAPFLFLHETSAMNNTTGRGPRGWLLLFSLATLALFAPPARPADVDKVAGSLKLVPADAEVYSVMLRNAEQWKAITSSKAWKKLTEMESVQAAWTEDQKQLN